MPRAPATPAESAAARSAADGLHLSLSQLLRLRARSSLLDISRGRRIRSRLAGGYLSPFRGRGLEFDEVRAWEQGDDPRTMDWRVTARTGTPHVKIYREERERPVILLADLGPSMRFGTRRALKSVACAEAAALIAWAAADNGDRVGGIVHGGGQRYAVRPRSRSSSPAGTCARARSPTNHCPSSSLIWSPGYFC